MLPTQTLNHILTNYGRNILTDTRKVEAMLRDLCHATEHKREINLIILALKENIPSELINNQPVNDMLVMRLIKKLDDAYFIPAQQAQTAIETWAKALNIALPKIAIQKPILQTPTQQIITPQPISKSVQSDNELDKGVWTDPKTGLMWARISIGQRWKNGQCVGDAKSLKWEDAQEECQNFRLAGFNDWRLPTIGELKTLMIENKAGYNCPQNILFQPRKDIWGHYWSGSPTVNYYDYVWSVSFNSGGSGNYYKDYDYHVRVVRSGQFITHQAISNPTQSDNELDKGVWTNPNTCLMWARISIGQQWINGQCVGDAQELNWENAKKECQNFRLAGFNDWQLPTIDELKTLLPQGKSGYYCPKDVLFQPMKNDWGFYWSDSYAYSGYDAWLVGFDSGYSYSGHKSFSYYARAVRSGQ